MFGTEKGMLTDSYISVCTMLFMCIYPGILWLAPLVESYYIILLVMSVSYNIMQVGLFNNKLTIL